MQSPTKGPYRLRLEGFRLGFGGLGLQVPELLTMLCMNSFRVGILSGLAQEHESPTIHRKRTDNSMKALRAGACGLSKDSQALRVSA